VSADRTSAIVMPNIEVGDRGVEFGLLSVRGRVLYSRRSEANEIKSVDVAGFGL